jgi:gluconolactonase
MDVSRHAPDGVPGRPASSEENDLMELQQVEVLADGLAFPEGPVAMPDGSVVVVEVAAGKLTRVDADRKVSPVAALGGGPNGAALGPDGAFYVCNNGGMTRDSRSVAAIQRVEPDTGQVDVLYTECDGKALGAPDDLVFDDAGRFWFTDFGGGAIYYAAPDGSSISRAITRLSAPNGIGLSPGGDVLYWAQTHTRQVHRRRLAGPGEVVASPGCETSVLVRGRELDRWSLLVGLPGVEELDSLAVDSSGAVCVGTLIDSGITVVSPEDGSHERYTLPEYLSDGAVTNICFGGADLQTAYITCSITGRLISCRWPRPGLRLAFQRLPGEG